MPTIAELILHLNAYPDNPRHALLMSLRDTLVAVCEENRIADVTGGKPDVLMPEGFDFAEVLSLGIECALSGVMHEREMGSQTPRQLLQEHVRDFAYENGMGIANAIEAIGCNVRDDKPIEYFAGTALAKLSLVDILAMLKLICTRCGEYTDDGGECGTCVNCRAPLCTHKETCS